MNLEEAKEYYTKLATTSGHTPEQVAAVMEVFGNEQFAKGVMPTSEFSRGLDAERSKMRPLQERNNYLENTWLPEAKAAYEKNLKGIEMLDKYRQTYGDLTQQSTSGEVQNAAIATGLSSDQVRQLLSTEMESRLAVRDRATLDLMDIRENYMDTFKSRMPLNEFEGYVSDKRQGGSNDSLNALYKDWVEPKLDEIRTKSQDERDKRIREEAIQDFASRNKVPVSTKPMELSLLHERLNAEKGEEAHSGRDAFLEALNDPKLTEAG